MWGEMTSPKITAIACSQNNFLKKKPYSNTRAVPAFIYHPGTMGQSLSITRSFVGVGPVSKYNPRYCGRGRRYRYTRTPSTQVIK